jgi:hypothetical protein
MEGAKLENERRSGVSERIVDDSMSMGKYILFVDTVWTLGYRISNANVTVGTHGLLYYETRSKRLENPHAGS